MKIRHNKKRNTAFIYESLIKEATAAIIKNDHKTKHKVVSILKKHFSEGSILKRHLECYRSLYESKSLNQTTAEKILIEAKMASRLLDTQGLFVSQSDLIKDVNEEFSTQFKKYDEELLGEQKRLLNYYISSFADNSLTLKTFLNDEILRLKEALREALELPEIKNDPEMLKKASLVLEKLDSFYSQKLNETVLLAVLKTQKLVKEVTPDVPHS